MHMPTVQHQLTILSTPRVSPRYRPRGWS